MDNKSKSLDRRKFIWDAATMGFMGAIGAGYVLPSCKQRERYESPVFPDRAPDGPVLKAGLIGCGGRGTGAAINFLNAGSNLQITAIADVFQDRIDSCRKALKERAGVDIPDENCFLGFDAYKRVLDSDVDVILEASLAYCRPLHFEAAVQSRKHVFLEKPASVDPVGVRSVMASGKMAESAGLSVVAGTNLRFQRDYVETFSMIKKGAIGYLTSANCFYNSGAAGYVRRQEGWCDMEAMIRNRHNWCWVTGDTIVNLLVHYIDILNWFFEKHPIKANGFGGRHQRTAGDMYDFFSVDYVFDDNRNYHGMTRSMDGCSNYRAQIIFGTKGYTNCQNTIWDYEGNTIWEYEYPLGEDGKQIRRVAVSPYDQEIINLVTAIRTNNPVNQTNDLAVSTLTGIMGRESAYTGKDLTWEDMINSNLKLGPEEYKWGPVNIKSETPIPGTAQIT